MLEQIIALFARLVVALETIAAAQTGTVVAAEVTTTAKGKKAATKPEDDEPEEKAKPAAKKGKGKKTEVEVDLTENRENIEYLVSLLVDHDEGGEEYQEILNNYNLRNFKKVIDEDVIAFEKELLEVASKYYTFD